MSDQQSAIQESSAEASAENTREIANMDETDWMTMLMEMRIVSA